MSVQQACPAGGDITLKRVEEGYKDPHGLYDALREHGRITFDASSGSWLVTGHAGVRRFLSDERFVSDIALAVTQTRKPARRSFISDAIQKQIIFLDGPGQLRVQRAVLVELSRRSDELTPPIQASAQMLAEKARERGEVDVVKEFAVPFSMQAISLILGLPTEDAAEIERLERWSTTFADVTSGHPRLDLEDIINLGEYFRARVAERGGTPSDDLIGAFLRDGGMESEEEVVIQCMMAFAAGRVTTQKLLSDGIPLLIPEWGPLRAAVQANPNSTRRLADELLRAVTPTRYVVRYATADVPVDEAAAGGPVIRRGEKVFLFLQAANRDPDAFSCPHALEPARQPNPHVSFGHGSHRCPGASVARIEIQAALQALLGTLAELRPHPTVPPAWDPNPNIGGYSSFRCLCS